ncbi:MAG: GNAT family N-acetyltransferase [Heliobacteriaceae bacterium]|nr:GNAT family N-acetyltransferase [Heliobacteriaceae bacterium]MDD4588204.1 GNAT family N-acetyltransferase [Heliobacteriaceae bacterium]
MTIRPAIPDDIPEIARLHIDTWQTACRDLVPAPYLAEMTFDRQVVLFTSIIGKNQQNIFGYVATVENKITGFAAGGPEPTGNRAYHGQLYTLFVAESYQGRGLGNRLFHAVTNRLKAMGIVSMLTWVLQDVPAYSFFTHLGGHQFTLKPIMIAGRELTEVALGWPNTTVIPPNPKRHF